MLFRATNAANWSSIIRIGAKMAVIRRRIARRAVSSHTQRAGKVPSGESRLKSRIHRKGHRNKPLNEREKRGNETRSKVRARVEHVFGAQSNDMGGTLVRGIGLVRAKARIGLKNLAYNMRRLVQLERLAAAALP